MKETDFQIYDEETLRFRLNRFKNWFSDEIPQKIIHSSTPENRFKVRTAWFVSLAADLWVAQSENVITNPSIQKEVNAYLDWYVNSFGTRGNVRNTREDIEKGNQIIDVILDAMPAKPLRLGVLE